MSDGATTGSKKPHYTEVMKQEIEAQKAEIEALRAQLAAGAQPVTAAPATPKKEEDPLVWITERTPAVFLVSKTMTMWLRHDVPHVRPPVPGVFISETSDPQPWGANPFDFRNEDRIEEQNNKVMMAKWHHLRVHKGIARQYWAHPDAVVPTETVIYPRKFVGWDKLLKEPKGEMDEIKEFCELRELVRTILQKSRNTYLNWDYHKKDFDPRFPNPYSNRLIGVGDTIKREINAMVGKQIDSAAVRG